MGRKEEADPEGHGQMTLYIHTRYKRKNMTKLRDWLRKGTFGER